MKILKKIVGLISFVLILGGAIALMWQYFRNKQLLEVLVANSIVKGSISVLQKMALSVLGVILGLIFLVVYLKIGSVVRRNERERRIALKEEQREQEEQNRQLRKEIDEARAEAEKAKKENELMRQTFVRTPSEDEVEEKAEEQA